MDDGQRVREIFTEIEQVGERILIDRREIVDLDRKRNKTREGIRAMDKTGNSSWICVGNTFLEVPLNYAKDYLEKDLDKTSKQINNLRNNLHSAVNKLQDLENKPVHKGFNLKPIERDSLPEF